MSAGYQEQGISDVTGLARLLDGLPDFVSAIVIDTSEDVTEELQPSEAVALTGRVAESRRRSFALGRVAARNALESLGSGRPPIPVGPDRSPVWPDDVVGSITHARSTAAAAVAWQSDTGGIGIDLEVRQAFPGLQRRVAFGVELDWLGRTTGETADIAVIEVFSAKEAIFKAFYPRVGRFFGFESARVERGVSGGWYYGRLVDDLDPLYPPSRVFRIDIGWHGDLVLATLVLDPD